MQMSRLVSEVAVTHLTVALYFQPGTLRTESLNHTNKDQVTFLTNTSNLVSKCVEAETQ
jgi:hypothetical protein